MSKKSIKTLNARLAALAAESEETREDLQQAYNVVFDDSGLLRDMISKVEASREYGVDTDGEIYSWARVDLTPFEDCKEYLEAWLADQGYRADWDNDALTMGHGENLHIQDDARHRRDNGVWLCGAGMSDQVIPESDYTCEDPDGRPYVDEVKRNALIEAYMKRTGYYPGVYRVDQHANVFYVDTRPPCPAEACAGRLSDHGADVYICDTCKIQAVRPAGGSDNDDASE